ncbi:MAG: hypothetical protein HMLKMBBP_03830 [Planctomycetes bacterium]|nr:hypothetical protein [Planctomycetota bacterium]
MRTILGRNPGRRAGRTLLEMTIASTAMVGVLAGAVPAFNAVTKNGDEGRTRSYVEADNRQTLLRLTREIMNTSLSQLHPVTGAEIVRVTQDSTAGYLTALSPGETDLAVDAMGGPGDDDDDDSGNGKGNNGVGLGNGGPNGDDGEILGGTVSAVRTVVGSVLGGKCGYTACAACADGVATGHQCGLADGAVNTSGGAFGGTPLNPIASGSGRRGKTTATRTWGATPALHSNKIYRPRLRSFGNTANSRLVFNKVAGFSIAATGEPVITWSTDITYRVIGRTLVREQDGNQAIISSNVSRFVVEETNDNTILVTLVTERRARATNEVTKQWNQIEVDPKN